MAIVKPFRALRPEASKASHIAALPYDVMDTKEARYEIEKEPLSFLRIDRPETSFEDGHDMYAPEVYEKAKEILEEMIRNGDFILDDRQYYYIYELTMEGRSQTGIVAVCSVDDYVHGVIKKHENTLARKEQDRIDHITALSAQTGPIFLSYRRNDEIEAEVIKAKAEEAVYDFTSDDGIRHRVWIIKDPGSADRIKDAFSAIDSIYIADGHHRCASACKVCLKKREEGNAKGGDGNEFDYFLSVLFPDSELKIMDYNRVVRDLNGLSESRFFDRLRKTFDITACGKDITRPAHKGQISMYLSGVWYLLDIKDDYKSDDAVDGLDVSILQREVLSPVLGIEDPRTDERIRFVGGIRGLEALRELVDSGMYDIAFAMYPTSIEELFNVADEGRLMPPKSTWFEPKLRSGLFIHMF